MLRTILYKLKFKWQKKLDKVLGGNFIYFVILHICFVFLNLIYNLSVVSRMFFTVRSPCIGVYFDFAAIVQLQWPIHNMNEIE